MKVCKKPKIKVIKFIDDNTSPFNTGVIEKEVNEFINSNEVVSIIDIKINTELRHMYIRSGGNSALCSDKTDINLYYTIIYIPK